MQELMGTGMTQENSDPRSGRCGIVLGLLLFMALLGACEAPTSDSARHAGEDLDVECEEPRPDACTFQYEPVCALQVSGNRPIEPREASTEWRTHGNGCTACSNAQVIGYREGPCEEALAD